MKKQRNESRHIYLFTGDGRGKTTASIGRAISAISNGLKVYIAFLIKGHDYDHGEFHTLAKLPNITFKSYGQKGFVWKHSVKQEHRIQAYKALEEAREAMLSGKYQVIVLDEINVVLANRVIEIEKFVDFIKARPTNVELVLSGRYADQQLIELSDYVSYFKEIKHPMNAGINARKGIDYADFC